jgi:dihydrolipoamide dehydrogenase
MKSNYSAIPRAVYTDPPLASVGLSSQAATDSGIEVDTQEMEIGKTARATTTGTRAGKLVLVADKRRGLLIGASAVGANADEWIGEAALAIRAQIPLEILADTVHAFPTISEAYEPPYRKLAGLVL